MDKTQKIKTMILNNYKSVREFSEHAGLPYTTVHSILQRGIDNSSVDNVIKICRALNITVDELLGSDEEETYYTNPETARLAQEAFEDPDLRILMSAKRDLSPESMKAVVDMVKLLKKKENPHEEVFPDDDYGEDFNQDHFEE